jgi:hypothetical protein
MEDSWGTICFVGTATSSVERVIHAIKKHEPNRFFPDGEDDGELYPDLTGWAWLAGKRVPVQSGFRGDVMVWEVADGYNEPIGDVW